MEVLLTQSKAKGTRFCEGMPIVPSLEEVPKMLAKERRISEGQAAEEGGRCRRHRVQKSTLVDDCQGDHTFFLGKGEVMRLRDGHTKPAMNAVGFFLYTQCDGNIGDKWPATMGVHTDCM
jgi:hypothetical protein